MLCQYSSDNPHVTILLQLPQVFSQQQSINRLLLNRPSRFASCHDETPRAGSSSDMAQSLQYSI